MGYTLRVSVLEHCQLRCSYCLPQGVKNFLPKKHWLNLANYEQIAHAMRPLSIEKVRFTGGEPLLREDLPSIINVFARAFNNAKRALTTNGQHFIPMKEALIDAGLHAVTFHLDTLQESRYHQLMGNGQIKTVLHAIDQAMGAGLKVKINLVVQKDINDDELYDFLRLSKALALQVRFIELMNTGAAKDYVGKTFISGKDILEKISCQSPITSLPRKNLHDPAELYLADDLGVIFGLIASDTRPFCAHCNRLRLSADGRLRTCLYEPIGHSLQFSSSKAPSDEELLKNIEAVVAKKTSFHPALKKDLKAFSMSQIGG